MAKKKVDFLIFSPILEKKNKQNLPLVKTSKTKKEQKIELLQERLYPDGHPAGISLKDSRRPCSHYDKRLQEM